jgi:hypothetical protein
MSVKLILFDGHISDVVYSAITLQCGRRVSRGEHVVFRCATQHACADCCDDTLDTCVQILDSCNRGSTNLILNKTPEK